MHYLISSGLALILLSCVAAIARSDYRNSQNLKPIPLAPDSPARDPNFPIIEDRNAK